MAGGVGGVSMATRAAPRLPWQRGRRGHGGWPRPGHVPLGARRPPAAGRTDGAGRDRGTGTAALRGCPCVPPANAADMSTAMNFSTKSFTPRPPDKGAFPLDHFGECSAFKEQFMECLRHSGYESAACRQRAMAYLECRMDRQLMANEPLEKLGFKDLKNEKSEEKPEKL